MTKDVRVYTLDVNCDNCDTDGTVEIKFGQPFEDASAEKHSTAACPTCGCHRLYKDKKNKNSPFGCGPVKY